MPAQHFNIKFVNGKWDCSPPHLSDKKADGAIFDVHRATGKTGVVLCFTNSRVFGVPSMSLPFGNGQHKAFTGNAGDSTNFHIQDGGTTCTRRKKKGEGPFDDPFQITIASDQEPPKRKK